jgi:NTP pyrophosphatase (non-canonical NTP hydrolase)
MLNFQDLQQRTHAYSKRNGFWEHARLNPEGVVMVDNPSIIPEKLALIQSEISEALEDWRSNKMGMLYDFHAVGMGIFSTPRHEGYIGKPVGFPSEMADAVIRIAELCEYLGIDLEKAIEEKMAYNETRPYKHGKKA